MQGMVKPVRTLLILLLAGVTASVLTASSEAIRGISWADSQHGWMSGCSLDDTCVLSTENGGRTWHRIGSFEVEGLVRTSARGGLVFELGRPGPLVWWTRDNGRHWYEATHSLVRGEPVGNGRFLFSQTRSSIFQVRPWPPRGRAPGRCRFCVWNGGSRSVEVAHVDQGQFAGIANLPGGVLAVIDSGDDAVPSRVLLRQHGRNTRMRLPVVAGIRPCANFYSADPVVAWPRIAVFGCTGSSSPDKAITWVSEDGGRTWRVYRG
jgi:hypothetical protein